MQLHEIKKGTGLKKKAGRIGRGNSSGRGNYSTKGLKGQKARSGGGVRPGFEGGQTPLLQRLPKLRGFKKYFKLVNEYRPVNLARLEADDRVKGGEITKALLLELGYIHAGEQVKILGNGELTKKLSFVDCEKVSATAAEKIKNAGGSILG